VAVCIACEVATGYRQFGVRGVMTDVMIAGSVGAGWSRGGLVAFLFRSLSLSKVGSARYDAVWVRGVDRCGRGSERCVHVSYWRYLVGEKLRMSWWPVRIWFCASLMLRRMVGSIVLFQASRSDVLARRRSSSGIWKMRRSMATMSGLLAYAMVVTFFCCLTIVGARLDETVRGGGVCGCTPIFPEGVALCPEECNKLARPSFA
jgi:hypothetical protein